MTVESMLIAKNRSQFNNIVNFMRSLIFMNTVEAEKQETTTTRNNYNEYEGAYLKLDSSLSYNFTKQQLLDYGFSESEATKYTNDPKAFQTAYMNGNTLCKVFLNSLRKKRVNEYTENNPYYRQFCGLPSDKSQYIYVTNDDKNSDDDPQYVLLHQVTVDKYPKTYARLFYERDVEKIYSDHKDYMYLQFLENPIDPYTIRNYEIFDIVYYDDSILSGSEIMYWFEAYKYAKNEIMQNDYIEAFETSYSAYVNVELVFILSFAFNIYCGKMLEKYAVRDYTDTEIIDIIESNGLSELKSLDISLLRRVVERLPDLKAYTGTEKVIDIIFDIVADASISVKRFYLKKKYTVDTQGNTNVDSNGLYNQKVDLVFQEKTIKRGVLSTDIIDNEYPYDNIVKDDDTWAGTTNIIDSDEKAAIKSAMKNELLKADFSNVITKYISVSKIIDMEVKLTEISNKLGLFYQYMNEKNNKISSDKIIYEGIETTALSLYAAWCIIFGKLNGLSDPDAIPLDKTIIEGIMKLRTTDRVSADALELSNVVIDLGAGTYPVLSEVTNSSGSTKLLSEIVESRLEGAKAKHPKFSHFSLKRTAQTPIEYQIKAISTYSSGNVENETIAYDQRENLSKTEVITETDSNGKTRKKTTITKYIINGSVKTSTDTDVEDGFDEENIVDTSKDISYVENPDNRKVYMYDIVTANKISLSGTQGITTSGLSPVYSYSKDDWYDGLYAYDGNNISEYTIKETMEDSNGKKNIKITEYSYKLTSPVAYVSNHYETTEDGFDISDPNIIKTSTTDKTVNPNFLKVYMYNNGEWTDTVNAWKETSLTVNNQRYITVPDGASFSLYAIYNYATTVGDYLTEDEIKKYLVSFKPMETLTIDELYDDYDANYEIIEAIKDKISKTCDFTEYQIWDTIYRANMTYHTLYSLFEGAKNYSEYIKGVSEEFYEYLDNAITSCETDNELKALMTKLYTAYKEYIEDISENNATIYTDESDIAGGEDLDQVTKLFEQFVSLYTQLYNSSYSITYDNENENSLILLYSTVKQQLTNGAIDFLELVDLQHRSKLYTNYEDWLILVYYFTAKLKSKYYETLDLSAGYYKLNGKTDAFSRPEYDFIEDDHIHDVLMTRLGQFLELKLEKYKEEKRTLNDETVGLTYDIVGDKIK